jgi:DNA-directed RNA polymerase subunit M/transcription elongation factor TFIIS
MSNCFKKYLSSDKNIKIFTNAVKDSAKNDDEYRELVFNVCDLFEQKIPIREVLKKIKTGKLNWNSEAFDNDRHILNEYDSFIENPIDVVEGIFECPRCGCKKVNSFAKQKRGCDEPTTTFAFCSECKKEWTENF